MNVGRIGTLRKRLGAPPVVLSSRTQGLHSRLAGARSVPSLCPLCDVGCATRVYAKDETIIAIEGDAASPVNAGTLCAKGSALYQFHVSPLRLTNCKYRAPYSPQWQDVSLSWTIEQVARRVAETRKQTIAAFAGDAVNNEALYLISKLYRGLGIALIDSVAFAAEGNVAPARAGFERLAEAKLIVIAGADPAANQPVAFRFALAAKARGAKIVHIDPRYTRTSAHADIHVPLRAGSDATLLRRLLEGLCSQAPASLPETLEPECGLSPGRFAALVQLFDEARRNGSITAICYGNGFARGEAGERNVRLAWRLREVSNAAGGDGSWFAFPGEAAARGANDLGVRSDRLPGGLASLDPADPRAVSLLKAWFGEHAVRENGFAADDLPQLVEPRGAALRALGAHALEGAFAWGADLLARDGGDGAANALGALRWLVTCDAVETSTSAFWRRHGADPALIGTEVFALPAASIGETAGSFTQNGSLVQTFAKAVDPPDDARSYAAHLYALGKVLKRGAALSEQKDVTTLRALTWDYDHLDAAERERGEPDPQALVREIGGIDASGAALTSASDLRDDGTTACGCATYCGFAPDGTPLGARRDAAAWGWSVPAQPFAGERPVEHRDESEDDGPPAALDERYPVLAVPFALGERYRPQASDAWSIWLDELQPQPFVELSPEFAAEHDIQNGAWVTLDTAGATLEARALISARLAPLSTGNGTVVHQVGVPAGFARDGASSDRGSAFACALRLGRHALAQDVAR